MALIINFELTEEVSTKIRGIYLAITPGITDEEIQEEILDNLNPQFIDLIQHKEMELGDIANKQRRRAILTKDPIVPKRPKKDKKPDSGGNP